MNTNNIAKLYIYPTDTVWGIGSNIYDEAAFNEIARIKKTSSDKPLSIMFNDLAEMIKSFSFPAGINEAWLRTFFQLESTLGLPVHSAQIVIPSWVHHGSDIVSIRLSENPLLKEIKSPFFSTSLNLTGEPPITSYADALAFQKMHAAGAILLGDPTYQLSGQSSTIVFFRNENFQIIRAGRMIDQIKSHLTVTGFPCG